MNVDEVLQRAMNAYSTGTLGQAELLFNQVLAADKQRFDALQMLGILQSRRRNYAEAVRLITCALEVQPRSAQAHADLGRIQFEMGDAQQATESYLRSLALDPDCTVALANYAVVLRGAGRSREALAHCDKALALKPDDPEVLRCRAAALDDLARHEEALALKLATEPPLLQGFGARLAAQRDTCPLLHRPVPAPYGGGLCDDARTSVAQRAA